MMEADTNKINAVQEKDQDPKIQTQKTQEKKIQSLKMQTNIIQTQKTQEKNGKNPEIFQLLRQRGIEFARRIVYNSFNY